MAESFASLLSELPRDPLFITLLSDDRRGDSTPYNGERHTEARDMHVLNDRMIQEEERLEQKEKQLQSLIDLERKRNLNYFYYVQVTLPQYSRSESKSAPERRGAARQAKSLRKSLGHQATEDNLPFSKGPRDMVASFEKEARMGVDAAGNATSNTFVPQKASGKPNQDDAQQWDARKPEVFQTVPDSQTIEQEPIRESSGGTTQESSNPEQIESIGEKRKFKLPTKRGVVVDLPPKPLQPKAAQASPSKEKTNDRSKNKHPVNKQQNKKTDFPRKTWNLRSQTKKQNSSSELHNLPSQTGASSGEISQGTSEVKLSENNDAQEIDSEMQSGTLKRVKIHKIAFVREEEPTAEEPAEKADTAKSLEIVPEERNSHSDTLSESMESVKTAKIVDERKEKDPSTQEVNTYSPTGDFSQMGSTEPGEIEIEIDGFEDMDTEYALPENPTTKDLSQSVEAGIESNETAQSPRGGNENKGEGDNSTPMEMKDKDPSTTEVVEESLDESPVGGDQTVNESDSKDSLSKQKPNGRIEELSASDRPAENDSDKSIEVPSTDVVSSTHFTQQEDDSESFIADSPRDFIADPDFLDDEELLAIAKELSFDESPAEELPSANEGPSSEVEKISSVDDSEQSPQTETLGDTMPAGTVNSETKATKQVKSSSHEASDVSKQDSRLTRVSELQGEKQDIPSKQDESDKPKRRTSKRVAMKAAEQHDITEPVNHAIVEKETTPAVGDQETEPFVSKTPESKSPTRGSEALDSSVQNVQDTQAHEQESEAQPAKKRGKPSTKTKSKSKSKSSLHEEQGVLSKGLVLDHGPDWASLDDSSQRVVGGRSTVRLLRAMERRSSSSAVSGNAPSDDSASTEISQNQSKNQEDTMNQDDLATEIAGQIALRSARRLRRQTTKANTNANETTIVEEGELQLEADQFEL